MVELDEDIKITLYKFALANAGKHNGTANLGAVISRTLGERPDIRSKAKEISILAKDIITEVNKMSHHEQVSVLRKKFSGIWEDKKGKVEKRKLSPLSDVKEGHFVVRLPPEPSGYMHMGHAMAGVINAAYAELYSGKIWLRFEDTNARKVKKEYYESFRDGYSWLGIKWDFEKNVSDDINIFYSYGEKMIKKGLAYACNCKPFDIKTNRFEGIECNCRPRTIEDNLEIWDKMLSGEFQEGEYIIRYKKDMAHQDYSFRDPNLFRIVDFPHPIHGNKYKVWPIYDFAVVIEDYLCKITHILRSLEFHVDLQNSLRLDLGLPPVSTIEFSRFKFEGTPLSKRLLRPLVENGLVSGWDDPRMPTILGLRRRGIIAEAVKEFTLNVGFTKSNHIFDWNMLFSVNRKKLDPLVKRFMFVPDPIRISIKDAPNRKIIMKFHPDKDLGSREVNTGGVFYVPKEDLFKLNVGNKFRLIELYNVEIEKLGRNNVECRYVGSEIINGTPKVQWVTEKNIEYKVILPEKLFNGEEYNKNSLRNIKGMIEPEASKLNIGEIIQFPRFGFCRIDSKDVAIFSHK